LRRCWKSNRS
jgi:hypothetical protein